MVNETNVTNVKNFSQDSLKERFEFVLTTNEFIVCQRYFKIFNLNEKSLNSLELFETMNYCVELIQNDLKKKSNLYNHYTAPQVFNNRAEYDAWISNPSHKLEDVCFVLFRDTEEVYVYNEGNLKFFDKRFNTSDYIGTTNEADAMPCNLKLTLLDNGKVIYSRMWDGNDYPRFIRNNIDLSNYKNKYNDDGKVFEAGLINLLTKNREDLVPIIINEINNTCSMPDKKYTTSLNYGGKKYYTNINRPMYFNWKKVTNKNKTNLNE